MKEAFDIFFSEMNRNWMEKRGCMPKIPCREKDMEKLEYLIVNSNRSKSGYVEWKPQLQKHDIDFAHCEQKLGFSINMQIKEYVSTYWFVNLEGVIIHNGERISVQLDKILPCYDMEQYVIGSFDKHETHYLTTGEYFLLGSYCSYNGDDSYLVQVSNSTGEVYIVQVIEKISIKIADSIEELLKK